MPPEPLARTVANGLRKARRERGFTQAELAEMVGLATEAYGRLKRGYSLPRADTLVRLARELQTSADSLLGLDGDRVGEAAATYQADDPPELQRLVRHLRRLPPRTLRAFGQLVTSFLSDLQGEP